MRKSYYWVEIYSPVIGWREITGAKGEKAYVFGWLDALSSFYPRPSYRLMINHPEAGVSVVETVRGASAPRPVTNLHAKSKVKNHE